ncbi:WD40 repeat-like protein [Corynespora cassiicola Philippines]|uniref:WD40 repeat-like protein n=1 Tax=Corynespora cassiicola Philippines TaxID=1448308 RepID=A0A2T2PA31_CORCC|nr:WD40 repeat-like protein [Corynespora cassiicola Philippines]
MKYQMATTSEAFFESYELPLHMERDFQVAGRPAEFAPGHPLKWGLEDSAIDLSERIFGTDERFPGLSDSAVSSDGKLLAVSGGSKTLIYDIATQELRQELDGSGVLHFRPTLDAQNDTELLEREAKPIYVLTSNVRDDIGLCGRQGRKSQRILWELNQNGRLLVDEEPIDSDAFASKAISFILPELKSRHEWSEEMVSRSQLHTEIKTSLMALDSEHRRRHNTILEDATVGSFSSTPFNKEGTLMLYHHCNGNTQNGMREAEKLPQVIVWDMEKGKPVHSLRGHTDAIMWSSFSPDGLHIASVAWDNTIRVYNSETGNLEWAAGKHEEHQAWSAEFSHDSAYIVWSTNGGRTIQVHHVSDGSLISTFTHDAKRDWARKFKWHPSNQMLAFSLGGTSFIWSPFGGPQGKIIQEITLPEPDAGRYPFLAIRNSGWDAEGRYFHFMTSDNSILVYDTYKNVKEMYKRPHGAKVQYVKKRFHVIYDDQGKRKLYITVDGDLKARFWKDEHQNERAEGGLNPDPKSEENHGIVDQPKEKEDVEVKEREEWVEKGASIWTAE